MQTDTLRIFEKTFLFFVPIVVTVWGYFPPPLGVKGPLLNTRKTINEDIRIKKTNILVLGSWGTLR